MASDDIRNYEQLRYVCVGIPATDKSQPLRIAHVVGLRTGKKEGGGNGACVRVCVCKRGLLGPMRRQCALLIDNIVHEMCWIAGARADGKCGATAPVPGGNVGGGGMETNGDRRARHHW